MKWFISFYNQKVREALMEWPSTLRAKFARILELIQKEGPNLGMPFTRIIDDNLFEIRIKACDGLGRILFCYMKRRELIILHIFVKKSQKMPKKDLRIAQKRLKEVIHYER